MQPRVAVSASIVNGNSYVSLRRIPLSRYTKYLARFLSLTPSSAVAEGSLHGRAEVARCGSEPNVRPSHVLGPASCIGFFGNS
jgi:hypothetical protein